MVDDRAIPEFHVGLSTHVVVGSGLVDRVGRYAATYGRRALVVCGEAHARVDGSLARLEGSLLAAGLEVELVEGIGPDPTVAAVDAGSLLARAWHADLIVALGGGSVIDTAKAIATSAAAEHLRSFADHLGGRRARDLVVDRTLPLVAVPTMPGSGSETNGTSVIIDDETGRKLSAHSDLAAPRIALLDPELVALADPVLVAPGLADAFCHALEAALAARSTPASDALAEQALRMLLRDGSTPVGAEVPPDERLAAITRTWWATNLAGQALTLAGSLVTHPLAHPVSARLGMRHGEAVAAIEPAVLAVFGERFMANGSAGRVAGWLDVRGATDPATALRGLITKLTRYCAILGVRQSLGDIGVDEPASLVIVRDARASASRGLANVPGGEPTVQELLRVLDVARTVGSSTPVRRILEAAAAAAARDASLDVATATRA
jgi:alcohol dehydrogenase class IV